MENRQIKFRAWVTYENRDKDYKISRINKMVYYPNFGTDLKSTVGWSTRDFIDIGSINEVGYKPLPNFILQQFTGLIDSNGTEIYEGDLIKCNLGTHKVEFHDASYGITIEHDCNFIPLQEIYYNDWNGVIVVGNIFDIEQSKKQVTDLLHVPYSEWEEMQPNEQTRYIAEHLQLCNERTKKLNNILANWKHNEKIQSETQEKTH